MKPDPNELVTLADGKTTSVVRRKNARFRLLIIAIQTITKLIVNDENRQLFFKIAWALGEAGEVEACEAIMKEAEEKPKSQYYYMYGGY